MDEGKKWCSGCKEWKNRGDFSKDTHRKDGLRSRCKKCCVASDAAYYAKHRNNILAKKSTYRDEHRAERSAYAAVYRVKNRNKIATYHAAYYATYYTKHREEIAARNAVWSRENPDKLRASYHRRRARKQGNGGTHTDKDIQRQGDCQKWRCWWCGEYCKDKYHEDHLVPLSKGGHNGPENIVISCPSCNLSKSNKLPEEFCGRLL